MLFALLAILLAGAAFAASDNWQIKITASGPSTDVANATLYVGATPISMEGKDATDAYVPPGVPTTMTLTITHGDLANKLMADLRTPWTEGTKVWSNIILGETGINPGDAVQLKFEPLTGSFAPPPGATYTLINTETGDTYDLNNPAANTLDLTVPDPYLGYIASYRIVVTMGTPFTPNVITRCGVSATTTARCTTSPAVDAAGNVYVGYDNGKIYKIDPSTGAAGGNLVVGATKEENSPRGRMTVYGNKMYLVSGKTSGANKIAQLYAVNIPALTKVTGFPVDLAAVSIDSTGAPAVDSNGDIYVGTNAGSILKIAAAGGAPTTIASGLGGNVYPPAVFGDLDMVWVTTDNGNLVCVSKTGTARASTAIGTPLTSTASVMYVGGSPKAIACGADKVSMYDLTTLTLSPTSFTASDLIGSTPFFTNDGKAFFATADGKLQGIDVTTMTSLPHFPVALPGAWISTDVFMPVKTTRTLPSQQVCNLNSGAVVANGKVYIGGGVAGAGYYMVDIASGNVKMCAGNDGAVGSPALVCTFDGSGNPVPTKAVFTNRDASVSVFNLP